MNKQDLTKKAGRFITFLAASYILYLTMDTLSRYFSDHTKKVQYLWDKESWMAFLFLWHGFIFILFYTIFRNRAMKIIVIGGIIFGIILEAFVYEKTQILNLFFYAPIFYGILFYLPLKLIRKIPYLSK